MVFIKAHWILTCIYVILIMKECKTQLPVDSTNAEVDRTLKLLDEGVKVIQLSELHRNVTLLVGNTGSGKSTFVQWIAGDNDKLISQELLEDSGDFIIKNNNRIGSSFLSTTIFPELVIDKNHQSAFYDNPGFSDTRNTSHDIASTYFIKRVTDHVKSLKLVMVVNYPSVRQGVDRQDFILLLRHFTDFVHNVEKFKDSIGIVVTKVDNIKSRSNLLIPDEKVISTVAKFFESVQKTLKDKSNFPETSHDEKVFCENAYKLLNILLIKNENSNYTRIAIFRRPDAAGPLSKIPLLQWGKKHVRRMLYDELIFTANSPDDFGFTISDKSKSEVNTLIDRINEIVWDNVTALLDKVQNDYASLFEKMNRKVNSFLENGELVDADAKDALDFDHRIRTGEREISGLVAVTNGSYTIRNLSNAMQTSIVDGLGFGACKDIVENIHTQGRYVEFLQTVSSKELTTKPLSVLFQQLDTYLTVKKLQFHKDSQAISLEIYAKNQKIMETIGSSIVEHYEKKIDSTEVDQIVTELKEGEEIVTKLMNHTCEGDFHSSKLSDDIRNSKLAAVSSTILIDAFSFTKNGKYYKFLNVFSNSTFDICKSRWVTPLRSAEKRLAELHQFMLFLNNMYGKFSEYDIQGNKSRYNVANLNDWGVAGKNPGILIDRNNFKTFLEKVGPLGVNGRHTVGNLSVTEFHVRLLNQVLDKTLKSQMYLNCSEPGKLVVRGDFIKLSDFVEVYNGKLCEYEIRQVDIFALKVIFINTDFTQNGVHLSIIAPKWEIIGRRVINLDGVPGKAHVEPKADDGVSEGSDGRDGLAGLPGGPAGNFLGIGRELIGIRNLTISASGGRGGPGQRGGNGMRGTDGRPARLGQSPMEYDDSSNLVLLFYNSFEDKYKVSGEQGGKGGNGGDGGRGGLGGMGGTIKILQLDAVSDVPVTLTDTGLEGISGEGGYGGPNGKDGRDLKASKCSKYIFFFRIRDGWCNIFDSKSRSSMNFGRLGFAGYSQRGVQVPRQGSVLQNIADTVRRYKNHLRESLVDYFKTTFLLEFAKILESNMEINSSYDASALVNEFQDLEKQQSRLSEKHYFPFFMESLLNRTTEYAKNPKYYDSSNSTINTLHILSTAIQSKLLK